MYGVIAFAEYKNIEKYGNGGEYKIHTFLCLFSKMAAVSIATVDNIRNVNSSTLFFLLILYIYNMIILPCCEIKKTTRFVSSPLKLETFISPVYFKMSF